MKIIKKYLLLIFFALSSAKLCGMENAGQESPESHGVLEKLTVTERFFTAVLIGHVEAVTRLIVHEHVDANTRNDDGFTPLHIAVQGQNIEMVKLLLSLGADVNIRDLRAQLSLSNLGHFLNPWWARLNFAALTPLEYGLLLSDQKVNEERSKNIEIIELLINSGTELNPHAVPLTPLHVAATLYSGEGLIELLTRHGAYVNLQNNRGILPCLLSIAYARPTNVSTLLAFGANVNEPDDSGETVLAAALSMLKNGLGFPQIDQILFCLLSFGARLNSEQLSILESFMPSSQTLNDPFIKALIRGMQAEAYMLLIRNTCMTEQTVEHYFLFALGRQDISLIRFLLSNFGSKIGQATRDMACLRAAQFGNVEILDYLYRSLRIEDSILDLAFVLSSRAYQLGTLEYLNNTGRISAPTIELVSARALDWEQAHILLYFYGQNSGQTANQTLPAIESPPDRHSYLLF